MPHEEDIFKEFVHGNRHFSLDIYKAARLLKGKDSNVLISPLGILSSLAVCFYKGARNATRKEIGETLHFPRVEEHILESMIETAVDAFYALRQVPGVKMFVGNRVHLPENLDLPQDHVEAVRSKRRVEFLVDSEDTRKGIDEWFQGETSGYITEMARYVEIKANSTTGSLVANGIYISGDWKTRFIMKEEPEKFHVNLKKEVNAHYMNVTGHFKFYRNDFLNFDLLEITYQGDRLSLLVFLPNDVDGLGKLEDMLTAQEMKSCVSVLTALRLQKIDVTLPRFVLEDVTSLKHVLPNMGSMFSDKDADLSGFLPGLHVAEVVHKVVLDVHPEGHFDARLFSSSSSKMEVCKVDHPFLFAVLDKESGFILAIGSVTDPSCNTF